MEEVVEVNCYEDLFGLLYGNFGLLGVIWVCKVLLLFNRIIFGLIFGNYFCESLFEDWEN